MTSIVSSITTIIDYYHQSYISYTFHAFIYQNYDADDDF
jgi:hypothetical protein